MTKHYCEECHLMWRKIHYHKGRALCSKCLRKYTNKCGGNAPELRYTLEEALAKSYTVSSLLCFPQVLIEKTVKIVFVNKPSLEENPDIYTKMTTLESMSFYIMKRVKSGGIVHGRLDLPWGYRAKLQGLAFKFVLTNETPTFITKNKEALKFIEQEDEDEVEAEVKATINENRIISKEAIDKFFGKENFDGNS